MGPSNHSGHLIHDWLSSDRLIKFFFFLWCRVRWSNRRGSWDGGPARTRSMCLWWCGCLLLGLDSADGLAWQTSSAKLTHLVCSPSATSALLPSSHYRHTSTPPLLLRHRPTSTTTCEPSAPPLVAEPCQKLWSSPSISTVHSLALHPLIISRKWRKWVVSWSHPSTCGDHFPAPK